MSKLSRQAYLETMIQFVKDHPEFALDHHYILQVIVEII